MKTKLKAGRAATGLITVCAIAAAVLMLAPAGTEPETKVDARPAVSTPEMVEAQLGDVIAAQGNAALKQIRADGVRLAPPDLSAVVVERPQE